MRYGQERPVKLYYSISEVSERLGVPTHVLRYWETEFPMLHPKKNRAGNRTYRERDVQLLERIRQLLHHEKFTVEGALRKLRESPEADFADEPEDSAPIATKPTLAPTTEPSSEPTMELSAKPNMEPTSEPTTEPTSEPNTEPSNEKLKHDLGQILRILKGVQ